jgi:hypothetical protein
LNKKVESGEHLTPTPLCASIGCGLVEVLTILLFTQPKFLRVCGSVRTWSRRELRGTEKLFEFGKKKRFNTKISAGDPPVCGW